MRFNSYESQCLKSHKEKRFSRLEHRNRMGLGQCLLQTANIFALVGKIICSTSSMAPQGFRTNKLQFPDCITFPNHNSCFVTCSLKLKWSFVLCSQHTVLIERLALIHIATVPDCCVPEVVQMQCSRDYTLADKAYIRDGRGNEKPRSFDVLQDQRSPQRPFPTMAHVPWDLLWPKHCSSLPKTDWTVHQTAWQERIMKVMVMSLHH